MWTVNDHITSDASDWTRLSKGRSGKEKRGKYENTAHLVLPLVVLTPLIRTPQLRIRCQFVDLSNHIFQRPVLIRHASGHRWRQAQRFVDTTEIVERGIERDRMNVVVELL
jgi:hypothetical protein